ncbi:MAG: hypothetical protein ACTSX6_06195 [Candidatus Heimdallarchaeaceae archaeon]
MTPDIKMMFSRSKNYIKRKVSNFFSKTKQAFIPRNIVEKIINMPRMDQVYWSKIIIGFFSGVIFGLTNFKEWPAALTMLLIFLLISTTWFLYLRNKEPGIKARSYYTSAMFQFFITMIAIWTLILNLVYLPHYDY